MLVKTGKTILTRFDFILMKKVNNSKAITFNFVKKLLQPKVYDRVKEILYKDITKPLVVEFDITSNCNQNCVTCISQRLLNKGEIPLSRIKSLLELFSLAGVKATVFTGGGEPLLHSEMPEPLHYAKKLGFESGLITNGTMLYKYADRLPGILSWLRVSMDASEPEKYHLLHYKDTAGKKSKIFQRIVNSMENFSKKKGESRLGFSFLAYIGKHWSGSIYDNVSQIYSACKLAKNIGCDYFELKPSTNQNHSLFLTQNELSSLNAQFKACKKLENDAFSVYSSESLQNFLLKKINSGDKEFLQEKFYTECLVAKLRTMVTPDGVFPCPYFRGNKELGHLVNLKKKNLTLYDFSKILKGISTDVNPAVDCNFYCIRHKQNVILHKLISDNLPIDDFLIDMNDVEKVDIFI